MSYHAADWANIFSSIPQLVLAAETALPQNATGADKLASVVGVVAPLLPVDKLAAVSPWIAGIVAFYKLAGIFKSGGVSTGVVGAVTGTVGASAGTVANPTV